MNWIDKEVAFYDFIWAYGVGAHTDCINQELYEDFAAGGDKFEEMKKLILQKFPTREIALGEFEVDKDIPPDPQPSEPDKVKPLAQYLGEYIDHEQTDNDENCGLIPGIDVDFRGQSISVCSWELEALFKQALDAYQSTENVTIKIERKT